MAVAVALVTTPVASAAPAPVAGATSGEPNASHTSGAAVVPAAGRLSVALLGSQPKHGKVEAPSAPVRTKDPGALRAAKTKAEAGTPRASATTQPSTATPSGSLSSVV